MKMFERENAVLRKAAENKTKKAGIRKTQLRKIARESRKTLMMYDKTNNVLEKFQEDLKMMTREDPFEDDSYETDNFENSNGSHSLEKGGGNGSQKTINME